MQAICKTRHMGKQMYFEDIVRYIWCYLLLLCVPFLYRELVILVVSQSKMQPNFTLATLSSFRIVIDELRWVSKPHIWKWDYNRRRFFCWTFCLFESRRLFNSLPRLQCERFIVLDTMYPRGYCAHIIVGLTQRLPCQSSIPHVPFHLVTGYYKEPFR